MINQLPYKNTAIALILCVLLGPIGLLYASILGGVVMLIVGAIILAAKAMSGIVLLWLVCCVWGVSAVECYNKKIRLQLN